MVGSSTNAWAIASASWGRAGRRTARCPTNLTRPPSRSPPAADDMRRANRAAMSAPPRRRS